MYSPRTYDQSRNNYFRLTHANVVAEVANSNTNGLTAQSIEIPTMFSDLIKRLLKKRPRWTYVLDYFEYHNLSNKWHPKRLHVYDLTATKQSLGTVLLDRHWQTGGMRYAMDSRKLSMARQRGSYTYTSDVNKAVKNCVGMFSAKTQLEIYNENRASVLSSTSQIVWQRQQIARQLQEGLTAPVMTYLMANTAELRRIPGLNGAKLDQLLEAKAEEDEMKPMARAMSQETYTTISIIDGLYFVQHNKEPVTVEELENLSESVRTKLGMLKLVEPDTLVPNIGYRSSGDGSTFVILPEDT